MPASTKVGSVSRARYEEIIAEDRKLIEVDTKIQFKIGDHALEGFADPEQFLTCRRERAAVRTHRLYLGSSHPARQFR